MTTLPVPWLLLAVGSTVLAQAPPRVTSLSPDHGTVAVEPRVHELTIVFDRDMDTRSHSLCGGGTTFPQVESTSWRDARTFVVRANLQPDHLYALELSCQSANGFRAADGQRLPPQPWRFCTAGTAAPDAAAQRQTNETALERLLEGLTDRYSYRDRLGVDWHELLEGRRNDLLTAPSTAALALRLADLLAAGEDPHVTVKWQDGVVPTVTRVITPNFHAEALAKAMPGLRKVNRIALSGRTDDGIGYLLVGTFERGQRDAFEQTIEALRALRDCKALVLDVRPNGGGDELLAQRLAAFFVGEDRVYAAHRVRDPKQPDGFGRRQDRSLRANQPPDVFARPVAVLMGPANMSSCEAFLLMMKQAPNAVLVGATSQGSSGNPMPHGLAPGLQVMLPSWQALRPDGSCFEGEGITPDIHVEATVADFADGDPVLRAALDRLRGKQ